MNRDDIKEAVLSFLPGLSVETLTSLLEGFEELGVESRADLVYVQEKDLERYLRPIQWRKLLNGLKNEAWHVTAWHVMVYRLSGQMERDASSNSNCSGRSKKTITRGQKRYDEERARVIARGPVDQYGCVRWCPEELPAGETEATLDEIKRQLCKMYSEEGMGGSERAEPLMEKKYVIQRRYLNSLPAPDIEGIKGEWPFLFSQRGLYSHLELNRHPGIEDVLANYVPEVSDKAACILLLLMAYFKEPKNAIMLETDVSEDNGATKHPCLIVQGDMMNPKAWMLCIDQVVSASDNFKLKSVFMCFLGINPETGSKAKKRHGNLNPHVSTFFRKLVDFEWMSV
ncbi:Nucleolar pre-ribosomal-associated protein 2 [Dissostichus eleginoides]|uniref:Nucleolar pre-ribosomal-associated protein 2 n=1 Tax=Dissostichus eleginoides TaxID=100907 RepID=A0AAD9CS22_DISEL|nr:Nucleolar pre-ribosomal-associated protein 2 [Dissostichus eleginoides]